MWMWISSWNREKFTPFWAKMAPEKLLWCGFYMDCIARTVGKFSLMVRKHLSILQRKPLLPALEWWPNILLWFLLLRLLKMLFLGTRTVWWFLKKRLRRKLLQLLRSTGCKWIQPPGCGIYPSVNANGWRFLKPCIETPEFLSWMSPLRFWFRRKWMYFLNPSFVWSNPVFLWYLSAINLSKWWLFATELQSCGMVKSPIR